MAAIALSELPLAALKKALRAEFEEVRSSHLTEALAAAVGRRTHAALLADLPTFQADPPIQLLDDDRFTQRLRELGYDVEDDFSFEFFTDAGVTSTVDPCGWYIKYTSSRARAWRNLMVHAINAGISQKLFSLRPDDHRWPGSARDGWFYDFDLPGNIPARAYVRDIGHGELSVNVAALPNGNLVQYWDAGFRAGEAFATGWLERKDGAWLQSSPGEFKCRKALLPVLASLDVEPLAYGDRGEVRM